MIQSRYLPPLLSLVPFLFPPLLARAFCWGGASSSLFTHLAPAGPFPAAARAPKTSRSPQPLYILTLTSHCYTLLLLLLTTEQPRINYGVEGRMDFFIRIAPHPCPQNMQEVDCHFFCDMPSKRGNMWDNTQNSMMKTDDGLYCLVEEGTNLNEMLLLHTSFFYFCLAIVSSYAVLLPHQAKFKFKSFKFKNFAFLYIFFRRLWRTLQRRRGRPSRMEVFLKIKNC